MERTAAGPNLCATLTALICIGVSSVVCAADNYSYTCRFDKKERTIEVVYLQRESSVPCEVRYIKEDEELILWNANYTTGYCEEQAAEFVKKQEEWGWECTQESVDVDVDTPSPEEIDPPDPEDSESEEQPPASTMTAMNHLSCMPS